MKMLWGKIIKLARENKKTVILVLFVALVPCLLEWIIFNSNALSNVSNDGWAAFWGSYCGGIATLIAVLLTIRSNRREYERKVEDKKNQRIKKSALIIYYDFKFALDNVCEFVKACQNDSAIGQSWRDKLLDSETYINQKFRSVFSQLYTDSDWISNVAELQDNSNSIDISKIYEIYGNLVSIRKWLNKNTPSSEKYCTAMNAIMSMVNTTSTQPTYNNDIQNILTQLKELAGIKDNT